MPFQPDQITYEDVIEAVDRIERRNIFLHPSTGYDVIINNTLFPPKEIIRQAHLIATGEDPGIIYGGEQVNSVLRKLGFEVVPKIKFWKLGCNWYNGAPSFFDILQDKKIVITVDVYPYGIGDIVLVTEGFTVYALAKVLTPLAPVSTRPDIQQLLAGVEVPTYDEGILFTEVEWYDLTDSQIFLYQLQSGIRQVRKQDVIANVLNIWENLRFSFNSINFYVKSYNDKSNPSWVYPCLVLIRRSWNDFGYVTCYELNFYKNDLERETIGEVKILQKDMLTTELPAEFAELDSNYCSLGQTLNYYNTLRANFPAEYMEIGKTLRDCVFYPDFKVGFEQTEGFQKSLLRSSEAQRVIYESLDLVQHGFYIPARSFYFEFDYKVPHASVAHSIDFSFNNDQHLTNRFFCLIGKNGTGKTQILSQLAKKLSNTNEKGTFRPERPVFTKVIAVSFSLFDNFELPKAEDISYELISVKNNKGLLDENEITNKLWRAYRTILKSRTRKNIWLNCIRMALDQDFLNNQVPQLETLASKEEFLETINRAFSSGQKIVFHFITRLVLILETNSIVIFDEPETHLHPNIAGKLIKALDYVLQNFSSFCILATHSPIIVQDIASRFIRILERRGNIPFIRQPDIEVLGENLTNINNNIFHVDKETELYKTILDALLETYSIEEIDMIFQGQLSFNARIYLQSKNRQKNG